MKSQKLKLYSVPAIVHGSFGCELEIHATSAKSAQAMVRAGLGAMPDGDGYDWDRWEESKTTVPTTWGKTEIVPE